MARRAVLIALISLSEPLQSRGATDGQFLVEKATSSEARDRDPAAMGTSDESEAHSSPRSAPIVALPPHQPTLSRILICWQADAKRCVWPGASVPTYAGSCGASAPDHRSRCRRRFARPADVLARA